MITFVNKEDKERVLTSPKLNIEIMYLEKKVSENREEIERVLHSNLPLEIVYLRINILKSQNEHLIKRINGK